MVWTNSSSISQQVSAGTERSRIGLVHGGDDRRWPGDRLRRYYPKRQPVHSRLAEPVAFGLPESISFRNPECISFRHPECISLRLAEPVPFADRDPLPV